MKLIFFALSSVHSLSHCSGKIMIAIIFSGYQVLKGTATLGTR